MIGSTLASRLGGLMGKTPPLATPTPAARDAAVDASSPGATADGAPIDEAGLPVDEPRASLRKTAGLGRPSLADQEAALADLPATPAEIATALADGLVPRLVVLSDARPGQRHEAGSIRLARQMRQSGLTTIVVDLTRHGDLARFMGVQETAPGLGDWQTGRASLSQAIHRDRDSAAHIVPAGGFDFAEADAAEIADLVFLVVACCGVYDCVLMACDTAATDLLPAILDDDTALILDRGEGRLGSLLDALDVLGVEDWLELAPASPASPAMT